MKTDARIPGIVCIGASAGGLRSMLVLVSGLPADLPWPVLVTQHFPSDVRSQLPQILSRVTDLPIREAVSGERLMPGTVLTSPSSAEMGVSRDGRITFRARKRGVPDSIDHLFETASAAAGTAMIAVVLSGLGSDGAAGTVAVSEAGGAVIAESPETAEWYDMPAAVLRAGMVDEVLPNHEIAAALVRIVSGVRGGAQEGPDLGRG